MIPYDPFSFISPRRQKAISLALLAAAAIFTWQYTGDARQSFADMCKLYGAADFAQCWRDSAKDREEFLAKIEEAGGLDAFQKAQAKANVERQEAERKRLAFVRRELSRTKLAEAEWGKPIMVDFGGHSVIKLADCGAGGKPGFAFHSTEKSPPGLKVRVGQHNGFLLLDLYTLVPGGELAADASVTARVAVFCLEGGKP